MEKILVAIDSRNLDRNAVLFACHLARLTGSKLTAIFLENLREEERIVLQSFETNPSQSSVTIIESTPEDEEEDLAEIRENNILLFKTLARESGIPSSVFLDRGVPAEELITESLFADVIVVDATAFSGVYEGTPTRFVKDILHDSGCPVIIAPDSFDHIDNIVFCYDGGRSSLYAMKQFSYLFPQLGKQRAKVIDIKEEGATPEEEARITEWLKTHFNNVEWLARGAETSAALFNYLLKKADDFVVMGAYGKGLLATFFTEDPDFGITRTTSLPIFIAHH